MWTRRGSEGEAARNSREETVAMRCHEIMKINVEHASPDECITDVAERMRDHMLGCVPVCDDEGRVIGVVTDRDLVLRVLAERRDPDDTRVRDVMSTGVVACRPHDPVSLAEHLMAQHQKSRIVITTEDDVLVGIVSLTDIAQHEEPLRTARVLRDVTARQFRFQGTKSVRPSTSRVKLSSLHELTGAAGEK
jgi:CBS domain-containing protein